MYRFAVSFLVLAALACSAQNTPVAQVSPELQQALIAQTEAVAQAQKSKDGDTLRRLLSDDFHSVGSEGHLHDKDEFVGDARDGKLSDYRLYNIKALRIDDNTVIVTCDAVIHGTEGDNIVVPHYQRLSGLWTKQGDQWRLRFQQATPRRPID